MKIVESKILRWMGFQRPYIVIFFKKSHLLRSPNLIIMMFHINTKGDMHKLSKFTGVMRYNEQKCDVTYRTYFSWCLTSGSCHFFVFNITCGQEVKITIHQYIGMTLVGLIKHSIVIHWSNRTCCSVCYYNGGWRG